MAGEDVLADLLARVAAGEQAALRALYDRSAGRLFAIVLRIVRDQTTAESVLAQTYATIWDRARGFDPAHGNALGFMIALARQHAIETVRARPHDLAIADSLRDDRGARAGLRRCLAELEEPARRAVLLAYRDGLSYGELAAVLGVSAETARALVSRALARMRHSLDDAP